MVNKKIIIIFLIIFILIGINSVNAINPSEFKMPNGYHEIGEANDGSFSFGNNNLKINIYDNTDLNHGLFFKDYTNHITSYVGDNIYQYQESAYYGYFEVIELNGHQYIIVSFANTNQGNSSQLYENLLEFNKLNNVEPLAV